MESESTYQKAWIRFKRNKLAMLSLGFIGLSLLLAIFGYRVIPDSSPNANTQYPSLTLLPPGSYWPMLRLNKEPSPKPEGLIMGWFTGKSPDFQLLPLDSDTAFHIAGLELVFQKKDAKLTTRVPLTQLYNPDNQDYIQQKYFPLGTDKYGRCMLSRLILGFRVSLTVGGIAVLISLTLGLILGALGGYLGGRVDDLIMLIINTVWSIPTLLLVFAIVLALGRGVSIIFMAVGLTMWVDVARVVRGQVIQLRSMPFVEAAKSMGVSTRLILIRHILPNLLGPVLVLTAANFATAILLESGLSYLGFGVQPPAPSWGNMLNENYGYALGGKPFLAMIPALAIALTVLAFNLIGNSLRDALDVKQ